MINHQKHRNHRGQKNQPLPGRVLPIRESEKATADSKGTNGEKGNTEHNFNKSLAKWTKIIGVATGLLFLSSVMQFIATQRQLQEMIKSRKDSDRSANDQIAVLADQAKGILSQADSLRESLLPRVKMALIPITDATAETFGYTPTWTNSGATAATHVSMWADMEIFGQPGAKTKVDFTKPLHIKLSSIGKDAVIDPGGTITAFTQNISIADAIAAASGKIAPVIWGYASFDDEFGSNYVMRFCELLSFTANPNLVRSGGGISVTPNLPNLSEGSQCNTREKTQKKAYTANSP